MASRKNIVVLFGGRSGEHEVSLSSAAYIIDTLKQCEAFHILPVAITREGRWYAYGGPTQAMREDRWYAEGPVTPATLVPDTSKPYLFTKRDGRSITYPVDCVFPVLHGPYGEDGTVQGMLELSGIPYVGCGVAASAIAMDKVFANTVFDQCDIPHTPWRALDRYTFIHRDEKMLDDLVQGMYYPLFVKPARGGSSLGIRRVASPDELVDAIEFAFQNDRKLVIEEGVRGRELEIAAFGGYGKPILSPVGEIVPDREFYDYDSKYKEDSASELIAPAKLRDDQLMRLRMIASEAWQALDCYGMARIDFFLTEDDRVLLNEINTIPGFVSISMYPRLFREAGYGDAELLRELIKFAFLRDS